ncbi:MAG TPA: rod shape-determining protein MreD [Candidatus Saccharimonadales bacterium]|nr:rod shape-determining protein MreD [Candidatus Saccharimonadales bacterium]
MRYVRGPAALVAAFAAQLSLSAAWPASVTFFDLPLLVVIYYGLNRGPTVGLSLGGAVGLIQDGLVGSLLGAGALSLSLAGYVAGTAVTRFVLNGPLAQFLVVAVATLAARLLEISTLAVMGRHLASPSLTTLMAGVAGNAFLGTALFTMLQQKRPT